LILGLSILPYQDYWNKINSTVSKAGEKFYKILDSMDSFSILTDETKRREFATEYLRRLRSKIAAEKDLYSQNLQLWIENEKERFDNNIQSNYHLALSNLTTRNIAYELTNKYIKLFAEVECKLLAVKDLAKFNGQHPVINETAELGHGTHFTVYPAEWSIKKNLAVKRLKQTSPEYAYLQYLEAHTHRKITQLCLTIPSKVREESPQIRMPHIVPLLYLYESVGKNSKLNLCMFLPRYSQSLDKFLQENIAKIKPDRVLQIGLDMADVLVLLHANDIVHRDFKAGNILMDENQQCYLADFGTAREWITNSTVLGTFPLAPEVISNSIYDGLASDVYSFGVFLYELLPKTTYSRPDGVTTITETLKTIAPLNEHNRIYENLIEWCLEPSPKDRPSAAMVKSKLLECLKELEKKTCMTCFNKLRKYRFQPCAHKLVCETCWNNLPKNSEGKSICIICWQIIEWVTEDDNNETYFPRRASVTDIGMAINSDALLW
jgi:serine/threonine protein kinase